MLVRKLWIKYIMNIEVHFVGYVYFMDLTNAQKMEHIKDRNVFWYLKVNLSIRYCCVGVGSVVIRPMHRDVQLWSDPCAVMFSCDPTHALWCSVVIWPMHCDVQLWSDPCTMLLSCDPTHALWCSIVIRPMYYAVQLWSDPCTMLFSCDPTHELCCSVVIRPMHYAVQLWSDPCTMLFSSTLLLIHLC